MAQRDFVSQIKEEISKDQANRVIEKKLRFIDMYKKRIHELLPLLITYDGVENTDIDTIKVETALRTNILPVVGLTTNDRLMFLGYIKSVNSINMPSNFFSYDRLTHEDIHWTIPTEYRLPSMTEITHLDGCKSGEFVVLRNKPVSFMSDDYIIDFYTDSLAEIVLSRYSLSIQSKVNTIFKGMIGDQSILQVAQQILSGKPAILVNETFDTDSIINLEQNNVSANMTANKTEFQNIQTEFFSMMGINSLAVDKNSGVSDVEANSNSEFTGSNANIYVKGRQNVFDMFNKRFGTNIIVRYDDKVTSELEKETNKVEGSVNNDNNNPL